MEVVIEYLVFLMMMEIEIKEINLDYWIIELELKKKWNLLWLIKNFWIKGKYLSELGNYLNVFNYV